MVKKLIPQFENFSLKRENQEDYDFLEFVSPDDAQVDDYRNLFDNLFK